MKLHVVMSLAVVGICGISASAAIIHVPADHPTIQAAINASANGDTVLVAPGTYNEAINFNGKNITIESSDGPAATTINATGLNTSVVKIPNGPSTLKGFTLTGGKGSDVNGNGSARRGGGVHVTGSNVALIDNIITGNTANGTNPVDPFATSGRGGGVYISDGSLTMRNCTITNNQSMGACGGGHGGGVYLLDGSLQTLHCTFIGNKATGQACAGTGQGIGGGVYVYDGTLTAVNCNFDDNDVSAAAAAGAGLILSGDKTQGTLIGCRVTRNNTHSCCQPPGANSVGITAEAPMTLVHCTIANNTLTGVTGNPSAAAGVFAWSGQEVTISNSIVFGNFGLEISPNANVQNSCIEGGYVGKGNLDSDPLFVDAAKGDFRLMVGSPAIDVGDVAELPADTFDLDGDGDMKESLPIDLDGNRRVVNGYVDMGAYEWQRTCEADITPSSPGVAGDGEVYVDDLLRVIGDWGPCEFCLGDINGDNVANTDDLLAIINGWGACR